MIKEKKMKTMADMFERLIGQDANFVSGILIPEMPDREIDGRKIRASTAKLKMTFEVGGVHHRVVMERFPDPFAGIRGLNPGPG